MSRVKGSLVDKNGEWVCEIIWCSDDGRHKISRKTGIKANCNDENLQLAIDVLAKLMTLYH